MDVKVMLVCSKCGYRVPDADVIGQGASKGAECAFVDCDGTYIDEE